MINYLGRSNAYHAEETGSYLAAMPAFIGSTDGIPCYGTGQNPCGYRFFSRTQKRITGKDWEEPVGEYHRSVTTF